MKSRKHVLWKLFLSTLYLSAFTFGGGYVIVTLLKRKFVDELHWIEDEEMLTNPDKEPTYEPEQTEVKPQPETPSDTPKHGDRKDGMIYINGFGWVKDEGGGGIGYTDTEMYQNGNKIGYFG